MRRSIASGFVVALSFLAPAAAQERAFDHPYYPLQVGNQWTYRSGKEQVVIRVEKQEPLAYKLPGGEGKEKADKVNGFVLKVTSGGRSLTEKVAVLGDGIYRFAAAGKEITPPLRFFKLPLKPGETWAVDSKTGDKSIKGTFVGGEDTVKLQLGGKNVSLRTMTAATKDFTVDGEPMELKYWFAEEYGMVKQQVQVGSSTVTLELQEFTPAKAK